MIKQEECVMIVDSIIMYAKELWECCPDDFGIQYISYDSIVFGGVNRVVWHAERGFRLDESYCTQKFINHFHKKMG